MSAYAKYKKAEQRIELFTFMWKWKLLSTEAIHHRIFAGQNSLHGTYKKLVRLEKRGLIKKHRLLTFKGCCWGITPKTFTYLKQFLPQLDQERYKFSSIDHDFLVSTIHLGRWLKQSPKNQDLFSEIQLHTYADELKPEWVPYANCVIPDGFWKRGDGDIVALEVELSDKSLDRYLCRAMYYSYIKNIKNILWVVLKPRLIKKMTKAILEKHIKNLDAHNFILLDDYLNNGWNAKIVQGDHIGSTMAELLREKGGTSLGGGRETPYELCMLNSRVSPKKSSV